MCYRIGSQVDNGVLHWGILLAQIGLTSRQRKVRIRSHE
jgi:hypothetical protein